jgi:hypothetical protein
MTISNFWLSIFASIIASIFMTISAKLTLEDGSNGRLDLVQLRCLQHLSG